MIHQEHCARKKVCPPCTSCKGERSSASSPGHLDGFTDLGRLSENSCQKRFPDGGGGSRRFPRLFGVADIVLGCWRRVRSFSDQLRAFFMHKSTQETAASGPCRQEGPDRILDRQSENFTLWESDHSDGDSQCILPYCIVLTRGWAGRREGGRSIYA